MLRLGGHKRIVLTCAVALFGVAAWVSAASPATVAKLSVPATLSVLEGNSGTTAVSVPVTLDAATTEPVTVSYTTIDGTAKVSDADYNALSGTLDFPVGATRRSVDVVVRGDTKLEDYQVLKFKLVGPVGAAISRSTAKITIRNDERPKVAGAGMKVPEGQVATFKPRLAQRYHQPITVSAQTENGTARAGSDYAATSRTVTFPAGSKAAVPVAVSTYTDALVEGNETFKLRVSGESVVNAVTPKATITENGCAGGTRTAPPGVSVPSSPSAPATLGPPAAVTGGTPWDLVFHDEFDNSTITNARWSTGMRNGARTLEGNKELQWYVAGNSTLTTDTVGGESLGVLRQRLTASTTGSEFYTVRTLSRIYPPASCPELYHADRMAPTDPTKVPYQFKSGMLNSAKSFGFRYGYVEARVRLPKGHALWPALWLRNWGPWSYEIDVMEGFDRDARVARSTAWWGSGSHIGTNNDNGDLGVKSDGTPCAAWPPLRDSSSNPDECTLSNASDLSAGYHVFGLHWTSGGYRVYVDGQLRWTSPTDTPVDSSYNHLILNLALANDEYEHDWLGVPVRPLDPNVLEGGWFPKPTVEWDYVRVWQAPGAHAVCTSGSC